MKRLGLVLAAAVLAWSACSRSDSSSTRFTAAASESVNDVELGNFTAVRARFDPTMLVSLSEDQLKTAWQQYLAMFGSFRSQGKPETLKRGSLTVVNVPLVMSKMEGQARVTFDADGKVGGLFFLRTGVPVP